MSKSIRFLPSYFFYLGPIVILERETVALHEITEACVYFRL